MSAKVIKPVVAKGLVSAGDYKEEFLSKMEWVTSKGSSSRSGSDVSVNLNSKGPKAPGNAVCFTFRNGTAQMISDTEYAQVCIHKNRIYFRESDSTCGYKLTKNTANVTKNNTKSSRENRYLKVTRMSDISKGFIGDYDLKYDDFLELYYVEKEI